MGWLQSLSKCENMNTKIEVSRSKQVKWSINNKKIDINRLHRDRFYNWFDQTFNLSELDNKNKE